MAGQYEFHGDLTAIDNCERGDNKAAGILQNYVDVHNVNKTSRRWARVLQWVENILFSSGRQYIEDILFNRLARTGGGVDGSTATLTAVKAASLTIPRPVNDLIGRYVESNVALLTENRPVPRATAKSDDVKDVDAATLSQLTLDYMFDRLTLAEKHRELARMILHCGVGWMEVCYDPAQPRYIKVPATVETPVEAAPGVPGLPKLRTKVTKPVTQFDAAGRPIYTEDVAYGDITAEIVSPFELHFPTVHRWNDTRMNWVMKEQLVPLSVIKDKYMNPDVQKTLGKRKGWYLDRVEKIQAMPPFNLPLWWWERLADLVEGQGPSIHLASPADTTNYTVVRTFDRKPCTNWPRGRTIITMGNQVIYDSPPKIGARAYDPRWPDRWHPYIYFAWDKLPGSVWARSLVTRILPKIKRVNAIDVSLIMWRRSCPIASWITPTSTTFVENMVAGRPGQIIQFDPRRTANVSPQVVFPPPFPEGILRERELQIQEMEMIAGTEEILRGQRPQGVNSAQMIAILRRQVLASRSGILQQWDESLEQEGSAVLQEVVKNVREDPVYLEALHILAREKQSRITIKSFSGSDLSDNVIVHIDTASQAFISREARQAKAIEFLQYSKGMAGLPPTLQQKLITEMDWDDAMNPQGPDVDRAKRLISWIKDRQFNMVVPMPEDNPQVILEFLINTKKSDAYWDFDVMQASALDQLIAAYKQMIQVMMAQQMQTQMIMAKNQAVLSGKAPVGKPGTEQENQ